MTATTGNATTSSATSGDSSATGTATTGGITSSASTGFTGTSTGSNETGDSSTDATGGSTSANGSSGVLGTNGGAASSSTTGQADGSAPIDFAVWTNRYDNVRSGADLEETILDTSNVTGSRFGLVFSRQVDGQIYAQPLYLGNLRMPDGKVHNVVYVATAHNGVYAFDGDDPAQPAPLWQRTDLGPPGPTSVFTCTDMTPEVGIISTPVIDRAAGTMFLVTKGLEGANWVQRLHALDVKTGAERAGSPVTIAAQVRGTGAGSAGGMVAFNPRTQLNRAGLLLVNGTVYIAFASHCDNGPYHGWIMAYAYDGTKFTQTRAFNVSPNGSQGGIWQAGVGLSADADSIYFAAGNGSTNPNASSLDLSEGVVRLSMIDFTVEDYWLPTAYGSLNGADADLSSGAILLPHDLLLTGSKDGQLYVLDKTNLGKYNNASDQILQTLRTPGKASGARGHLHGGPLITKLPTAAKRYSYGRKIRR